MKRNVHFFAFALAWGVLLMWSGSVLAAEGPAQAGGTWEMSVQGGPETSTQTLTIQQDGSAIKGNVKGRRGEWPVEGSVTGNQINFTLKIDTPGGTLAIEHAGTVEGDSMKGTFRTEEFGGEWTAKRVSGTGEK